MYLEPCNYKPCEKPTEILVDDVLVPASKEYYGGERYIRAGQALAIGDSIFKVPRLTIDPGAAIEFNLFNDLRHYTVVIKELVITSSTKNDFELNFRWYEDNFQELYASLNGKDGDDAEEPVYVRNGLTGGSGEKGKTRHSPAIFVFIENITVQGTLEETSFNFSLQGIVGGKGGDGGDGSNGMDGVRGSHGRLTDSFGGCKRGKNGGRGGSPGLGGRGGDGGCGGDGPKLEIYYSSTDALNILERSKYNVDGADPVDLEGRAGGSGRHGTPGEPGLGGLGGSRAGNCRGGHRGPIGEPQKGSQIWNNWHMGDGLPGTAGRSGKYEYYELDGLTSSVFWDPNGPLTKPDILENND